MKGIRWPESSEDCGPVSQRSLYFLIKFLLSSHGEKAKKGTYLAVLG